MLPGGRCRVVWFTRALFGGGSVHPRDFGSLAHAQGMVGSSVVLMFVFARFQVRWDHPGLLGSLARAQGFVEFTSAPFGSLGSYGAFGVIYVRLASRSG